MLCDKEEASPSVLVYSSVGDSCDFYKKWSLGRSKDYQCCYTYYREDIDTSLDIERNSDFFEKRKGGKFQNFFHIFKKLPAFDYYVVLDDDLDVSSEQIQSMVQHMHKNNFGVGSPTHSPDGRISWKHMKTQKNSQCRETDFVEMTAVIFSREELMKFFEAFEPYVDILLGFGTDFIIKNSCSQPFILFDNVSVVNPHDHQKGIEQREILTLRTQQQATEAWNSVKKAFETTSAETTDLPILCISLMRAHERRDQIQKLWIEQKQCNVEFIDAIDRRDVLSGSVEFTNPAASLRKLTAGEIACSLSHAKAIQIAKNRGYARCMIIEDDAIPLFATSQELNEIVNHHHQEFSHSRIALLHKPARSSPLSEIAVKKHFSLLNRAPWGAYGYVVESKEYDRLRRLYSSLVMPADWYWDKIYAKMKSISISNIPLVEHRSKTTYIGNEFRGQRRKFIE